MYGTVYVTVHDTVHIDGSMTWQHISGPKISRTVHALHMIIFNQTASLFKPGQIVLLFKQRGQTAYC